MLGFSTVKKQTAFLFQNSENVILSYCKWLQAVFLHNMYQYAWTFAYIIEKMLQRAVYSSPLWPRELKSWCFYSNFNKPVRHDSIHSWLHCSLQAEENDRHRYYTACVCLYTAYPENDPSSSHSHSPLLVVEYSKHV